MLMVQVPLPCYREGGEGVRTLAEKTKYFFPASTKIARYHQLFSYSQERSSGESAFTSYPPHPLSGPERGNRDEKINNLLY